MNVWYNLPTIFRKSRTLWLPRLILLWTALITVLLFSSTTSAAPGTNKVLTFQGRLLTSTGGVVADGYYNMEFKIYEGGTGADQGNTDGTLKWTETYINNSNPTGAVQVKNGFFAVTLGSRTAFGDSVDWNNDTIWLSMNVAGNDTACTTFGSAPCAADGEMLPMKRITAVPFALNSEMLGGKKAENFIQLAQGVQTDASTNTSSIFINKTGTGNLVQLQSAGSDIFNITSAGNIIFGNTADKSISIAPSEADTAGRDLTLAAGEGGSGDGSDGGDLIIQGGSAGGTNGGGGNVVIDAGAATGSGDDGTIAIGSAHASAITIGSTSGAVAQEINIGTNNTAGSSTNVTVGSGSGADSGTTTVQAKNAVSLVTDGTTRATFNDTNTVYFGNGVASTAPSDFTIQGTDSAAGAVAGGSITVQGGNATTGNANGGNVILSGGSGSGNGASGLVVLTTPTFSTVANDANCYAGGALVASSCTVSDTTINNASAVIVGFSATSQTATLPDPGNQTAGRILYVMAASNSEDFTILANGDATQMTMRRGTAATFLWNGSDWTPASGSSLATMQDTYNTSTQNGSSAAEITLNGSSATNGVTIQDSSSNPVNSTLFEVKSAASTPILSVNSTSADYATNGMVHNDPSFAANWPAVGSASVTRIATDGQEASDSAQVVAGTAAGNGVANKLSAAPRINTAYRVTVYARLVSGSAFTDFKVRYTPDGGTTFVDCTSYNTQTVVDSGWTQITCTINTGSTPVTTPYIHFVQPTEAASSRSFLIDAFSLMLPSSSAPNVQVGSGDENSGETTLFKVDKGTEAPTADDPTVLLGSMYYDTTLGKLQCYEADGWGSCGASPDNFVTLSPEYPNAVMNGSNPGIMTSDICSDELDINDGTSGQPTVCGTNETYNFYNWKSSEVTPQVKSMYITYQLPSSFKEFVSGTTLLMGRTDSNDASVTYQIYRKEEGNGLTSCGGTIAVSTGVQTTWQNANANGIADPSTCGFAAGDSIVLRVNLTSANNANAYISNLNFTFSHQ